MTYLGIDTEGARELVATLREIAADVEPIQNLIIEGEQLADLGTTTCLVLDEIAEDAWRSAGQIATALLIVERLQLRFAKPFWFRPDAVRAESHSGPTRPLWDATSNRPWNLVHQVSSHNSFVEAGGVDSLFADGVRSFELDIHRGAPTDFTREPLPWPTAYPLVAVAIDHVEHDGGRPEDWRVYHTSLDTESHYQYLSDGIAAVVSLDTTEPLTIFVDNKDKFGGTHTADRFDQLLDESIGDRLYTPADFVARAPGATSVREALIVAGWPTVAELEGRILVVLTDETDGYETMTTARAFVASDPGFDRSEDGLVHLADDDVVFHNADARGLTSEEHAALIATTSVVRTYFGPPCAGDDQDALAANYRAVDVSEVMSHCVDPGDVDIDE